MNCSLWIKLQWLDLVLCIRLSLNPAFIVILISISVLGNHAEPLFVCLLVTCIPFREKHLLKSLAYFLFL
jgi:hypothetical protein